VIARLTDLTREPGDGGFGFCSRKLAKTQLKRMALEGAEIPGLV